MPAVTCVEVSRGRRRLTVQVEGYDLAGTLTSGQAFRWAAVSGGWEGGGGSALGEIDRAPRGHLGGGGRAGRELEVD